jgi:hypothetical protein
MLYSVLYTAIVNKNWKTERRAGDAFDTVLSTDPRRVRRDWRVGGRTVFTETVAGHYTPARKLRALAAWNEWKAAA